MHGKLLNSLSVFTHEYIRIICDSDLEICKRVRENIKINAINDKVDVIEKLGQPVLAQRIRAPSKIWAADVKPWNEITLALRKQD